MNIETLYVVVGRVKKDGKPWRACTVHASLNAAYDQADRWNGGSRQAARHFKIARPYEYKVWTYTLELP